MKKWFIPFLGTDLFVGVSLVLAQCGSPAYACPKFVEFFPDPVEVSDQEGEFVEIRLDDFQDIVRPDSLCVQFESKKPFCFAYPVVSSFVIVRDSLRCADFTDVSCGLAPSLSLPNSRESEWKLWAGACRDSVLLMRPKAGKSLRRVKDSDEWEVAEPSFGVQPSSEFNPKLRISEIHHCPLEPEPEWVEIYNASDKALSMQQFRFCNRGKNWGSMRGDTLAPFEVAVLTRDTLMLREFFGFKDVRLFQVSMGFLNNTAGSISVCWGDSVIDSVAWDKSTVECPSGFSPMSGTAENTPGFLGKSRREKGESEEPFTYRLSSRVVRRRGAPLRVYVESAYPVQLRLLDSSGHEEWKTSVPPHSNAWWQVPVAQGAGLGVAYVSLSTGRFEKVLGILLRP